MTSKRLRPVGPPSSSVFFNSGRAKRRTHGPTARLATGAIVTAHLDCALKPAPCPGPLRPIESSLKRRDLSGITIAKQASVIHLWRVNDLAGVQKSARPFSSRLEDHGGSCPGTEHIRKHGPAHFRQEYPCRPISIQQSVPLHDEHRTYGVGREMHQMR